MKKYVILFVFVLGHCAWASSSSEPAYCSPEKFSQLEIPSPLNATDNKSLQRMHAFRLGQTTLVGLAVGDSKTPMTQKLANTLSTPNVDQNKYCTWYFATSNKTALASFVSRPIQDPFSIPAEKAEQVFMNAIETSFFQNGNESFMNCAQDHHYIAMGCTQQRHRGPTVFGMLLAFSGCTPEHAFKIVDNVWGLNGLKPEVRMNAIKAAYQYGSKNQNERARFVDYLTRK